MRLQLRGAGRAALVLCAWTRLTAAESDAQRGREMVVGPSAQTSSIVARGSTETALYADTDHVTVVTPVATAEIADRLSAWSIRGQYLVDVISAASVDVVSTASQRWHEVRHAGSVRGAYELGDVGLRGSAAISREPDYASIAFGASVAYDFLGKSHTVLVGYARDHDTIGRAGTPFEIFSHTLGQDTLSAGITLTLNRSTVLSVMHDLLLERGDQSKPYRYIPMFS